MTWHKDHASHRSPMLQVSQAVNAWREMPSAEEAAAGASQPSQDIRRTVGLSGATTVVADQQRPPTSAAAASKPSTSAAAAEDDDDDEIEVLKEQSLDEVLAVSSTSQLLRPHCGSALSCLAAT